MLSDEQKAEILDWGRACQSSYHIDSTPGHRFGGLGSNLEENQAGLLGYVEEIARAIEQATREQLLAGVGMEPVAWQYPYRHLITGDVVWNQTPRLPPAGYTNSHLAARAIYTADQLAAAIAAAKAEQREKDAQWLEDEAAAMDDQRNHALDTNTIGGRRISDHSQIQSFACDRRIMGEAYRIAADAIREGAQS